DLLRKERITRRITVETIAKDLKLNVKYIKALETSDYGSLPADPYVRVYLKSLAKYLSLDSDEVLTSFYKERGMSLERKDTSSKIEISMQKKDGNSGNPMLVFTIILIVLLAAFSFFANKYGWISSEPQDQQEIPDYLTEFGSDSIQESGSVSEDTIIPSALQQPDVFDISNRDTTTTTPAAVSSPLAVKTPMTLKISTKSDSVWIQVFSDGNSWKNLIYKNQTRDFSAQDSFNVHVGNNSTINYVLNGEALKINGKGVLTFKVGTNGIPEIWPTSKWNKVFKDRL
ncbi:MAG: helix-turn-helix domain-containing protein, partial [Fibrobacter sp.]|nr:helix-turn-helix domain-containing protein [Fibrobacter sp.]